MQVTRMLYVTQLYNGGTGIQFKIVAKEILSSVAILAYYAI